MKQFEQNAHATLGMLRRNSKLLITLFILMLGTGIPELRKPEDLEFLKKQLYLGMSDAQAMAALD
jgi:phosphatidylinositol-4,5-bisphosphate 3-kinase